MVKSLVLALLLLFTNTAWAVTLAWDPNTEADLAGYKVYWGTASRQYGSSQNVGSVATATVNPTGSGTFYFAVTAYDTSGNESGFSNEVFAQVTGPSPIAVTVVLLNPATADTVITPAPASYVIKWHIDGVLTDTDTVPGGADKTTPVPSGQHLVVADIYASDGVSLLGSGSLTVGTALPPTPGTPGVVLQTVGPVSAQFAIAWTTSGTPEYLWRVGFNDGSGLQSGMSVTNALTLAMPYHSTGLAATASVCVQAKDAAGTLSAESCNGFTVPAKPVTPTDPQCTILRSDMDKGIAAIDAVIKKPRRTIIDLANAVKAWMELIRSQCK